MLLILFIFTILLNFVIGISKKRNNCILLFTILLMGILFIGNITDPDMLNYIRYYNNSAISSDYFTHSSEISFYLFNKICSSLNLDIKIYKSIIFFICFFLLKQTIDYFKANYHLFLSFYLPFNFIMNIIQFRFCLAFCIVLFALRYIIDQNNKNLYLYTILVLFASTIHSVSILSLIFLLYTLKNKNIVIYLLLFTILFLFILVFIIPNDYLQQLLLKLDIEDARITLYFNTLNKGTGFIFIIVPILYNIFIIYRFFNSSYKSFLIYVYILLLAYLPIYIFSIHFYRLPQLLNILTYAMACHEIQLLNFHKKRFYQIIICIILNIFLWYVISLIIIDNNYFYNNIIVPIFEFNYFVGA